MKNSKYILLITAILTLFSSCNKEELNLYYPTDELVSYFPFEGNLRDVHGNTPEGTKSEFGVIYDNGRSGQGIKLDGTSGNVEFDRTDFNTGNSISVSLWFQTDDDGAGLTLVENSDFSIFTDFSSIAFVIWGTSRVTTVHADFLPNSWNHFVATYDGDSIKLYTNEALVFVGQTTITLDINDRTLRISPFSNWPGKIDELFIYDKALTQEEVTQLLNR